jgi:hypothetical protein
MDYYNEFFYTMNSLVNEVKYLERRVEYLDERYKTDKRDEYSVEAYALEKVAKNLRAVLESSDRYSELLDDYGVLKGG